MSYELLNLLFQFLDRFALLVLATVGLAIIFGMMGIINLAHGEFILVGAYTTTLSFHAGVPLPFAMVLAVAVTAVYGLLVERLIIRHFYGRLLDSMVVTFGLSIVMIQLTRIRFGNSLDRIATPFGSISYGVYSYSTYRVALAGAALVVLGAIYWLFTRTSYGVRARATMQDAETARSVGVDTDRMYAATFALGAGLAGLTGALYAPLVSITPTLGTNEFLVEAFVTVVVGGSSVVLGTSLAAALLGAVNAFFTWVPGVGSTFLGVIAMLLATIVAIRLMPSGVTGLLERWRRDRSESR